MTQSLKRLQVKHNRILELSIAGMSNKAISEEMGLTTVAIQNILSSPVAQNELARRLEDRRLRMNDIQEAKDLTAREILLGASNQAAETQRDLLRSPTEKVRQIAAMDILDRTGYPKMSKNESTEVHATIMIDENVLGRMQRASVEAFGEPLNVPRLKSKENEDVA